MINLKIHIGRKIETKMDMTLKSSAEKVAVSQSSSLETQAHGGNKGNG